MNKIQWDEALCVGVTEIDADHQQLAALINLLADHYHLPSNAPAVEEILTALSSYTSYHFEREERFLSRQHDAGLRLHQKDHRQFLNTLSQIVHGAALGQVDLRRLTEFLVRWWPRHILDQDMHLNHDQSVTKH